MRPPYKGGYAVIDFSKKTQFTGQSAGYCETPLHPPTRDNVFDSLLLVQTKEKYEKEKEKIAVRNCSN